ncbi:uncharacterized protein LOC143917857 [Arctopsyche grandis]|uniref:uncharacterized protein LOC143917857 n=1 Tax=Arctopsyche grandis TaxID=121162 RepID=UPI00406D993C
MLLQQGPGVGTAAGPGPSVNPDGALDVVRRRLKEGWTVHTGRDGRLYYCNHVTHAAGWLPPAESWLSSAHGDLPYGWEQATDHRSRPYYINHLNKTTTYEAPIVGCDGGGGDGEVECHPEPRTVTLQRSSDLGFGFVAGSEKPVIVRFVTEGGPSVGKLEPGDQILRVNGEEVVSAAREHVIRLVRACPTSVTLQVCQPSAGGAPGRRSALLTRAARARLRARPRPPRVRFAESVCVNGSPLFPPSAFSLGDLCLPPMANVLKVFLENGQTKSFKYDATTTVQDVVTSLKDKLCLSAGEHFSLVVEHVKSLRRNKLTLLDPKETLARIASRPGAHKLRCLFRVSFVPTSAADLAQKDLNSMDYLYMQCCNDVAQERFAPELQPDVALRLAALHMHQHALAHNMSPAKLTVKAVEREFGLERFVPCGLLESMKRKELRRLIGHFLKLNAQMTGNQQKHLSQLQAKLHYLDIISSLPSYGAKCFSSNQPERVLLVSPRFGLSQIAGIRNSVPTLISSLEDLVGIRLTREDELSYNVNIFLQRDRVLTFSMEDRDGAELALVLAGYFRLVTGKELDVDQEREPVTDDSAPPYLSQHNVVPAKWSYVNYDDPSVLSKSHYVTFTMPPPYHSTPKITQNGFDTNMNATIANKNHANLSGSPLIYDRKGGNITNSIYENYQDADDYGKNDTTWAEENMGFDFQSILSLEILENTSDARLIEARNEEVLKRVTEMQKLVENSEQYLNEQVELSFKNHSKMNGDDGNSYWLETSVDKLESDNESSLSRISSLDDNPGKLKHSDSLILLTETINQGLNGINNDLNSILNAGKKPNEDPLTQRQSQGLSAILNNCGLTDALLALNNDLSQSESDNDSLYTPTSSPIHRHQAKSTSIQSKAIRTSFGLHSPDNPLYSSQPNGREQNLRAYLNQLRENSTNNRTNGTNTETTSDATSSENRDSDPDLIDLTLLPPPQTPDELDSITQVPQVINTVPASFADESDPNKKDANDKHVKDPSLDEFLATVVIEPPTLKVTPAVELTPEEIMSFIIPPPPTCMSMTKTADNVIYSNESQIIQHMKELGQEAQKPMCNGQVVKGNVRVSEIRDMFNAKSLSQARNSLIINEKNIEKSNCDNNIISTSSPNPKRRHTAPNGHIIDYPTVERKGVFSCCGKDKSKPNEDQEKAEEKLADSNECDIKPPPRCSEDNVKPPERPPKSLTVVNSVRPRSNSFTYNSNGLSIAEPPENRFNTLNSRKIDAKIFTQQNGDIHHEFSNGYISNMMPPCLPPRGDAALNIPPHILLPPKKPPLPPVPSIETLKMKAALKHPPPILKNGVEQKVASIGSPHFLRNQNFFKDIELETLSQPECVIHSPPSSNKVGHVRSHSETKNTILKNKEMSTIFSLCSPQMNRKFTSSTMNHSDASSERGLSSGSFNGSDYKIVPPNFSTLRNEHNSRTNHVRFKDQVDAFNCSTLPSPILKQKLGECGVGGNGHVVSVEILLQKTEVAVDGLLSRLHQVAQTCSHQHAQGGGEDIDERKFQEARDQLTNEAVALVNGSRALVASLAAGVPRGVAAPLAECLTPLRKLADLSQALGRHTSSPLQTRNLVLRVHDVAAAFKELAGADMARVVREHIRKMSDPQQSEATTSLEGQLALRAECLANVLATLLRSLRVFSP